MSWVDGVIAIIVIIATYRGLRLGILRQLGSLAGFVTGFVVGIVVAPPLAGQVTTLPVRQVLALVIVATFVVAGSILGRFIGGIANTAMRRLHLGRADQIGGAIFAALGALVACWLVAGILATVSTGGLDVAIGQSRLLAVLDTVMPPVPTVETRVQSLLHSADFPSVFNEVVAPTIADFAVPPRAKAIANLGGALDAVLKVEAENSCGVDREGTAFVVGHDLVVTAAHVVAGAARITVDGDVARLLRLDPDNDIAILAVDTGSAPSVRLIGSPAKGTAAAIAGYPLNGALTVVAAAVDGDLVARGPDIYDGATVTRDLVTLSANVQPGNSGSPVLVDGRATAMVFSKSTVQTDVAYGVPARIIATELAQVTVTSPSVSTGACPAE